VSGPLYDVLLIAHVVAGVVGIGAIAVAGYEASRAAALPDPAGDARVRRFFKPGVDWPGRFIFLVPALGLALLLGGDSSQVSAPWPWAGLGIWSIVAAVATAVCWPAERRAQEALAALSNGESAGDAGANHLADLRRACARMETGAVLVTVCFVAAVIVMVIQP